MAKANAGPGERPPLSQQHRQDTDTLACPKANKHVVLGMLDKVQIQYCEHMLFYISARYCVLSIRININIQYVYRYTYVGM